MKTNVVMLATLFFSGSLFSQITDSKPKTDHCGPRTEDYASASDVTLEQFKSQKMLIAECNIGENSGDASTDVSQITIHAYTFDWVGKSGVKQVTVNSNSLSVVAPILEKAQPGDIIMFMDFKATDQSGNNIPIDNWIILLK